jgi:hypothetical protein
VPAATKTEAALKLVSPEPILYWCYGQSLESRYSRSSAVSGGGAAGMVGASIGQAIMNRRLAKVRPANAVLLPRIMTVALSAGQVFIFAGRAPADGPVATLQRDQVEAAHSGHVWHRLDLVSTTGEGQRVHTVMAFGPGRGPKRFRQIIGELRPQRTRQPSP